MFKIVPSLSVVEGKIVRLKKGDFSNQLKYNASPLDVAKAFEDHGVEVMHFFDLDGHKRESPVNYHTLETLAAYTNLKIDFTGGIRTDGDIHKVLEHGATYFTISSVAVNNYDLFASWIVSYGREKLSLMAHSDNGKIVYKAFKKRTDIDLFEHIEYFYNRGLKYLKVTDLNRDGLLEGPNFELYKEVKKRFPDAYIAASGGVRSVDDIKQLKDIGLYTVIIGRALYEGKITFSDLLQFTK